MRLQALSWLASIALLATAGCGKPEPPGPPTAIGSRDPTAVLGGSRTDAPAPPLQDAQGRAVPLPRLPAGAVAQMAMVAPDAALAVWVQEDHVVAADWRAGSGWSAPRPLETIHGEASDPQLASNGRGVALAIWRHTVGRIESLRFSRHDPATGWSAPDVMPGALPRPRSPGAPTERPESGAPRLQMDADGNAFAEWPSGFSDDEVQSARYVAGHGWTRALSEAVGGAAVGALPPASAAR